jgi:hypothetical protein
MVNIALGIFEKPHKFLVTGRVPGRTPMVNIVRSSFGQHMTSYEDAPGKTRYLWCNIAHSRFRAGDLNKLVGVFRVREVAPVPSR